MMVVWWGVIGVATCFEPMVGMATALVTVVCILIIAFVKA